MQTWITELRQLGPQNLVLAIAGNKVDLDSQRRVSTLSVPGYHVGILAARGRGGEGAISVEGLNINMYIGRGIISIEVATLERGQSQSSPAPSYPLYQTLQSLARVQRCFDL